MQIRRTSHHLHLAAEHVQQCGEALLKKRTVSEWVCDFSFPSTKATAFPSSSPTHDLRYEQQSKSFFCSDFVLYNLAFSAGIVAAIMSRMSPAASFRKNAMRSQPRCLLTMLNCTLFSFIMYAIL